jgi:heterodisulfide reductase subunit A
MALTHLSSHTWAEEEVGEPLPLGDEEQIGVFVCHCGNNIGGVIDVPEVVAYARGLPDVAYAEASMFTCAASTQAALVETIRAQGLNRVVVAACSPKTHEGIFRRVCLKAGLNPFLLEMVNLRNHDSWVHKSEPEEATRKAFDMVRMGVDKARLLEPLEVNEQPMDQRALVIGGGVAGMAAATNLAQQGFATYLVERQTRLGGIVRSLAHLAPAELDAAELANGMERATRAAGVEIRTATEIETIGGHIGNFNARLSTGEEICAGAVILATGARPYEPTEFGYGKDPQVITNLDLERREDVDAERVTFVGCVGSRRDRGGEDGEYPAGCSRYCCESMIALPRHSYLQPPRRGAVRVGDARRGPVLPLRPRSAPGEGAGLSRRRGDHVRLPTGRTAADPY